MCGDQQYAYKEEISRGNFCEALFRFIILIWTVHTENDKMGEFTFEGLKENAIR